MKTFFSIIILTCSIQLLAQVPQGISYQAIAFDANGIPVTNSNIGVKVSLMDNSATGTVIYSELHTPFSNAQGLINFNIGQGTPISGNFSNINWAQNSKFLKVELDPTGGTNYISVGTNQLMSVPYALFSENTNESNIQGLSTANSLASTNGSMIMVYTSNYAYAFAVSSSGNPTWYQQFLNGTIQGAIATDSVLTIYTDLYIYSFTYSNTGNPTWYQQFINGNFSGIKITGNTIVIYTTSYAYGFTKSSTGNPTWYQQFLNGPVLNSSATGNLIVLYTSDYAYGFTKSSTGNPTWYQQYLNSTPLGIVPE